MIYIVKGSTGEYADRYDWIVGAAHSRSQADKITEDLNDKLKELNIHNTNKEASYEEREISRDLMKNFDRNFRLDYTGTYYEVVEIEEL